MVHLVFCFGIWTLIFSSLFWRLIAIAKEAVNHLRRLHQIPCDKCAYFIGDYRLKCTVNPMVAMSETAIGCRDFLYDKQRSVCHSCTSQCSDTRKQPKYSPVKSKLTYFFK